MKVAENYREIKCETCGVVVTRRLDHGNIPRFCSRACFKNQNGGTREQACKTCNKLFTRLASHQGVYCSKECYSQGSRKGERSNCLQCGREFYIPVHRLNRRAGRPGCCSSRCQALYYRGRRNHRFKGGVYTHTQLQEAHVRMPREGYSGPYVGLHRIIASCEIDRLLTKDEFVIRINGDRTDNRVENLFICSNSEHASMRAGSLAWPTKSNLHEYGRRAGG